MIFFNDEVKLKINIIGYEYENSVNDDDANWLIVEISVESLDGDHWSAVDPCLRTVELIELKKWLSSILEKKTTPTKLYFMENELHFIYKKNDEISVALDYAFHPNWKKYDFNKDSEVIFNFYTDDKKIKGLITEIDGLIHKFPEIKIN